MATFRSYPLQWLSLTVVAAGAAIHLWFLFKVFTPKSLSGLLFPLVVLTPWFLQLVSDRLAANRRRAPYVSLFAGLTYTGFGAWVFWDTIYVHPDPQGGLVFLVLPVAASIAEVLLILGLVLTRSKSVSARVAANDA